MQTCTLRDEWKSVGVSGRGGNEWDECDGRGKGGGDGFKEHFGECCGELARWYTYGLQRACNPDWGCWRCEGIAEMSVVGVVILV